MFELAPLINIEHNNSPVIWKTIYYIKIINLMFLKAHNLLLTLTIFIRKENI